MLKMPRAQTQITQCAENHEDRNSPGERQSIDSNNEMTHLVELSDKVFKVAIIKMLEQVLKNSLGKKLK